MNDEAVRRWNEVAAHFDALVELAPIERAARLAQLTEADAALAAEVAALLAADGDAASLLDGDAAAAIAWHDIGNTLAPGQILGHYRPLQPVGEGGMGEVWLAERTDGADEQRVAVKVLKRGMDSPAIRRRFLQERRILARLQHPHIVRLLDGGLAADGRPFYVMEAVAGDSLTAHANRRRLDLRARVALLIKVAEAVGYAHGQLVVHRDLKPSNILVDAAGEPRVLDFGIAKLLEDSGEAETTSTGLRVLSPAYAAPEQILGETVGTAADVYALGLVACELLVGELPRRRRGGTALQLAQEADGEICARASSMAAAMSPERVAALYGTTSDPLRLTRALAGDLDLILATALQRRSERRYAGALDLADDLRRWLQRRPIRARPDSRGYRLRQFTRRHRLGVAAAALVLLSLLGGAALALWQAGVARDAAQRAERQLARSERVKAFVLALFREQDPVSRARAQARSPADLIGDGLRQVDATLDAEPELRAELLRDLGEIQIGLGQMAEGRQTLERAWALQRQLHGEDSAAGAEALAALADAAYAGGDVATAARLLPQALALLRRTHGPEHPRTAQAEATLAVTEMIGGRIDAALELARHAIAVQRSPAGNPAQLAQNLNTLGRILQESSRYDEALAAYAEALALIERRFGADHVRSVTLHAQTADVLRYLRRYDEAMAAYDDALRIERAQLPAGHALIGGTLSRQGDLLRRMRRHDEAERVFAEALAILANRQTGQYAQALQNYGNLAHARGDLTAAIERYRLSFDTFRRASGDSIYTWLTAFAVVDVLVEAGRLDEAETLAQQANPALHNISKPGSYERSHAAAVTGLLRLAQGRREEAQALLREALEVRRAIYGEDHGEASEARMALAAALRGGDATARREASTLLTRAQQALAREDAGPLLRARLQLEWTDLHLAGCERQSARSAYASARAALDALQPPDPLLERRAAALTTRLTVACATDARG